MPSSLALDVDPEEERGTLHPTTEKGSKESTPMDFAPEEVKHGKSHELISSQNTERGEAAKKTSNLQNDGPDTDFASINPKKNAGFQMAPSVGEQKDANRPDNRFGHRHSDANNQGHFNVRGRRQRKRQKKMKKDAAPVPTHNYDSPLGSEFESDHDKNIDSDLEEAQAKATYGKKRCKFEELKSSEGGKEKSIDHAKPSAKNRESSKSLSVPTCSNETNSGSTPTLSTVVTVSTKPKNGTTAQTGPPAMLHSGKTVGKANSSDPNRIEEVPGENHLFF